MNHRVLVTGLGCISSLGTDTSAFWHGLSAGRSAISALAGVDPGIRMPVGAQVRDYQPDEHFTDEQLVILDRFSQFAVVAAREAVSDSGLHSDHETLACSAAIIGTGCGGKQTDEDTYQQLYKKGRARAHPLTIPRGMPCAAASMVSHHLGLKGPVFSVTSACASGAHAVIQGITMVQTGLVDVAIVGGTDAPFTYGLLKAWEAMRVVSDDTCRPFSADRTGIVLGEGAAMLVLESEEHAHARGRAGYAELAGYGMSSDAGHITRPDVGGIASALSAALRSSGIGANEIDYINAHGTATTANDVSETQAIRRVFGASAGKMAVSSTKSMHGHALGAASAMELVATVLAISNHCIPPTANFTLPGEGCDLDYVPNTARETKIRTALSNSFAFGGLNAVLVVKAV